MADKARQRKRLRKLYDLHAWVGFQLAAVMFVILATGTIATVSNELDWLVFEQMRASQKPKEVKEQTAASWRNMYASIAERYPEGRITTLGTMGSDYFSYRARVAFEAKSDRYVHVDQWTYEVTGDISLLTIQRFFRDLHRYLFMPAMPGLPIVTAFAFILLISVYTGLKTTRNWKVALWRLRLAQGTRVFLSDLHKVFGLWGLWFSTLIIITGIWYLFEFSARVAGFSLEPPAPKVEHVTAVKDVNMLSVKRFESAFKKAQLAIPNWTITTVQLPRADTALLRFQGMSTNPLLRDRAHKVYMDPTTLEVLAVQQPENMAWGNYLNEHADPLHFGYFAGITSKLIWFVFGLALTGLSFTGVMMTYKRTKSKSITGAQLATLPIFCLSAFYFYFWLARYT
ncbi:MULTISPECIES: PepSY-associated TM helix domain-containing protein [Pseudoalteromonas]|uniref:PepSY-associated TM helix domain-containing protein n=1 Tax=Pseudoalteromonas TaxID=53246 RepID=UPI001C95E87C|nr:MULTISPECIES: PepSY-associated TM helix domain-containing protein [Pseudoalteromonas]MCG7539595.1 PepSY domain-containing protein [Pseudoalteromonas sp. OF7H-1]QZO11558.1 PepSY domain-containing protein [Pseudoalteromonas piscicida]